METLYDKIEDAVEFTANANPPYSPAQIKRIAYNLVFQTDNFDSPCRKWKDCLIVYRTWVSFKIHLSFARKQILELKSSARVVAFGSVNTLMMETTAQLANLATIIANDQTTISELARTINWLATTAITASTTLSAVSAGIAVLRV